MVRDRPLASRDVVARVAVLGSGKGSNLQALLDDPVVRPWIALVMSDREDSGVLRRAEAAGVSGIFIDPSAYGSRAEYDTAVLSVLSMENIEYVVLAGFNRILTGPFVRAFEGRMLNVHPSLLPAFAGGLHAVRDALEWGVKVTGVTVHLVVEEVDHGPVVLQEAVPVASGDDEPALLDRIHAVEHRLYPRALRLLVEGKLKVEGRMVHLLEDV
jgi:phosphoribosylglycinamide formyltransferase-1